MSRIEEALRRAAATPEWADGRNSAVAAEARALVVEASVPERDALAQLPRQSEISQRQPAQSLMRPQTVRRLRPETFPAFLDGKLVVSPEVGPVTVEEYRRLAATLHDAQVQRGLKTLMVSSAVPREGKTLTIANLALTLSESYQRRVLLIDADLRRPALHEIFGITNRAGLADVVRSLARPLPLVEVSPCLSVLTAGCPDATPLAQLTSNSLRAVVSDAAAHFDWVLLDTPPIALLPDAQIIAQLCEAVLFVIAAGATPYALVQRCIAALGPDRIIGAVLNRVEAAALPDNEYYRHYNAIERASLK